jgi:cytochrome bd-type quinol oxidase subunit 1
MQTYIVAPWSTVEIFAAITIGLVVVTIILRTVRQADRERLNKNLTK